MGNKAENELRSRVVRDRNRFSTPHLSGSMPANMQETVGDSSVRVGKISSG